MGTMAVELERDAGEDRASGEDEEEAAADSEDEERKEEAERARKGQYVEFRRGFDKIKTEHQGTQNESNKIKDQGNNMFSMGLYSQASMLYSEAIELQPENPVLFCNRAMAYLKQDMADEALADAETSLGLDSSESNIKAYWRKAQALADLGRSEDSEAAADEGMKLQPGNRHLNQVRRKAREANTRKRLCGPAWVGQVSQARGGIEKRLQFHDNGVMTMSVFGHEVSATYDLSVEGVPHSMYIKMQQTGDLRGTGPPPPPVPYIYEFHEDDQELWICQPVGTTELPTKFEGPGFDRLRRSQGETAPAEEEDSEPLDSRCEQYISEMNQVMPLMPAQLPERPGEEEILEEARLMESISQLKRKFGLRVHQRAFELAKDPASAPSAELSELAVGLQRRLVLRKILPPPPEVVPAAAPEPAATPGPKAPAAAPGRPSGCLAGCLVCGRAA